MTFLGDEGEVTQVKERPILFSGPMVRAILEGRKTQTRRVVTRFALPGCSADCAGPDGYDTVTDGGIVRIPWRPETIACLKSPWDGVNRLWVRETWRSTDTLDFMAYRADVGTYRWMECVDPDNCRWRPSIFMPRHLSRITLEVSAVRVQRLQEISEEDAKAEGIESIYIDQAHKAWKGYGVEDFHRTAADSFRSLWDSINAKRGFGWDKNPWVWAITFKPCNGVMG
jgi:hypothetical protein